MVGIISLVVVGIISLVVGCLSVGFSLWGRVEDDWVGHVTREGGIKGAKMSSGHSER